MNKSIYLRPRASQDIDDHVAYIAENNVDVALKFFDSIRQTIAQLARMPGMGSFYRSRNPQLKGLQKWAVKSFKTYLIFYIEQDNTIEIVRILYASRDISSILDLEV